MPFQLPIYLRGRVYTLHTRVHGKQVKRSLHTRNQLVATIRAVRLLETLVMPIPDLQTALQGAKNGKRYELDLSRGIAKSEGHEDHQRLMQALKALHKQAQEAPKRAPEGGFATPSTPSHPPSGYTLHTLKTKFFQFRDHLTPATLIDYGTNVAEFDKFFPGLALEGITDTVVTDYIGKLKEKGNSGKTVDKKVACLRSLFNFAIKQKLFPGTNPASERRLTPKSYGAGQKPFLENDLKAVFDRDEFRQFKTTRPAFYLLLRLGLVTGMRVSASASLKPSQLVAPEIFITH